ncbi:hypothetical protein BDQ17DRAFT_1366088 [Cyathus striatus]|nr:hypothetical protein BDQ17DRAFT_1366088 [Cyathus striatus]
MSAVLPSQEQISGILTAVGYINHLGIYEVCLTLNMEISFIWGSRWSLMKVLYLLTRYLTFVDVSLSVVSSLIHSPSEHYCLQINRGAAWKRTLVIISIIWVVTWSTQFGLTSYQAITYNYGIQDIVHAMNLKGCIVTGGKTGLVFANYALLLAYDGVVTFLMVIPAYRTLRSGGRSRLVYTMFRDAVTLINMVVILSLGAFYFSIILMLERVIHSILACRVVLHARKQSQKDDSIHIDSIPRA